MTMKIDSKLISSDLESGDPARVRSALMALDDAWRQRSFVTMPMPQPYCLEAFGDAAPVAVVLTYFSVLENYAAFDPVPTLTETRRAMLEAIVRYGQANDELVHHLAILLRTDAHPRSAAEDVLTQVQLLGSEDPLVAHTAYRLVDLLLEADATRPATIEALRRWTFLEDFGELIAQIRPRLSPSELERLSEE